MSFWQYMFDHYLVHLTLALVVFCVLIIDVPAGQEYTPALIFSEFTNVVSLVAFCIGAYEGLKRLKINVWVVHGLTILIANFLTVMLDFNLDLFVFGYGQMMHADLPQVDQLSGAVFWGEYLSDMKYAAAFWGLSCLITYALNKQKGQIVYETQAKTSMNVTGFLKELPADWRDQIDVLEAQENYIKVYVGEKNKTILYKFKDAISEMGDLVGLQVHRSYWINKNSIAEFKKSSSGRGEIKTVSGQIIPVSRTYLKMVETL